jgi:hypothetical protein
VLGGQGTSRVGMSIHNKLLGDKPEGFFDGLNLDLTSLTVLAFPHGNSKGEEPVGEDVQWKDGARVVSMEAAVHFPCLPVAFSLGPIHCCRSNHLPRNVLQTLNFSHWGPPPESTTGCWAAETWCQMKSRNQGQRGHAWNETTSGPLRGGMLCPP